MTLRPSCILLCFFLLTAQSARAGKIVIVTDQADKSAAKDLQQLLKTTSPFSEMKTLSVEIIAKSGSELAGCRRHPFASDRVLDCTALMPGILADTNADRVVIMKDSKEYAGSGDKAGGLGATATTSLGSRGALHELLHSFGFADEYSFATVTEANAYCDPAQNGPNVAFFADAPPYSSDAEARSRHAQDIPWFGRIKSETKIASPPNLGTPEAGRIGLYSAQNCKLAETKIRSWRPGDEQSVSIMEKVSGSIPKSFYETIASQLNEEISTTSAAVPSDSYRGSSGNKSKSGKAVR